MSEWKLENHFVNHNYLTTLSQTLPESYISTTQINLSTATKPEIMHDA